MKNKTEPKLEFKIETEQKSDWNKIRNWLVHFNWRLILAKATKCGYQMMNRMRKGGNQILIKQKFQLQTICDYCH